MILGIHSGGTVIPLASVASAKGLRSGGYRVRTVDGEDHDIDDLSWTMAIQAPASTFPAAPGTYMLSVVLEEDKSLSLDRIVVLGWSVGYDAVTRPVVIDPEALISDVWQIEHPSGHVERSDGRQWPSADAWFADQKP